MENRNVKKPVRLSGRLQALADRVKPGNIVADVGCDHGFLSIYLVEQNIAPRVIAGDVRPGPLSAARCHVEERGLQSYIELRLSDGLAEFAPGEAQTMICAGMGGKLMQKILTDHPEVTDSFEEFILQPQSELAQFRVFLRNHGFQILDEDILSEEGKFYFLFHVSKHRTLQAMDLAIPDPETAVPGKIADQFGYLLLKRRNPVLKSYLEKELMNALAVKKQLTASLASAGESARFSAGRRNNEERIALLQEALAMFDKEE